MKPRTDPDPRRAQAPGDAQPPPAGPPAAARPVREHVGRLLPLLGDDSPRVRAVLRAEFDAAGRAGRAALERATRASDARARAHARALLLELERGLVVRRLVRHVSRPIVELEPALLLLGQMDRPRFDARPYLRALDAMGAEVARRAARRESPIARARVLVEYLGDELGYRGDTEDYHHPDNVHLHRVIERRRGLPLTLVTLYMSVARRAGLRVGALPLPGHVLLRLYGREQNLMVDPFQGGETRSQATLMSYLARHRLAFQASWFRDAQDLSLFARQVANLANGLSKHGQRREAALLAPLKNALARRL